MENKKYFAFISYSHKDAVFTGRLHRKLESYNISSVFETDNKKQKLYPVCRDETAFSTGDLSSIIKEKLTESKKLIVVCTEASAQSKYVCEEVSFFAENFGKENIIPVICEKYSSEEERIAMLPGILKNSASEILDIYRYEDNYRQMFLKIVAGVLDISYETVAKRDTQMMKKRIMLRCIASIAALLILCTTAFFGIRHFKRGMISRDVEAAKELCETQLYGGLDNFLKSGDEAKKWYLDTSEILSGVRERINFEKGATLKICRGTPYENSIEILDEGMFIDNEKSLYHFRGRIFNVNNMNPVMEFSENEFVYYGDGEKTEFMTKGTFCSRIYYSNQNRKFFIFMDNSKNNDLFVFDTVSRELETIDGVSFPDMCSGKYIYFSENGEISKFDMDTYEILSVCRGFAPFTVGNDGRVFCCEENRVFKKNKSEYTQGLFLSPDGKRLFVIDRGRLDAYDTSDMSLSYSFEIPDLSCSMSFDGDSGVIYSYYSQEHVLYPANMFYINFRISDGGIISHRDISYVNDELNPGIDIVKLFLDVSDNGKNLAYNVSDTVVFLEDTENDDFYEFEFDSEIYNLAFYDDGSLLRVFLANGEVHTIAAKAGGSIRNLKSSMVMSDIDNINNIIIAEGNMLAKPINYGSTYRVLFEGKGQIFFAGQTKNYFVFRTVSPRANEIDYYICKKDTYEVLKVPCLWFLEVYADRWDYENDIVYDCINEKLYDLNKGVFCENNNNMLDWKKIGDGCFVRVIYESERAKVQFHKNGEEKLLMEANEDEIYLFVKATDNGFVVYGRKVIAKFNPDGKEVFRKEVNLGQNVGSDSELEGCLISFDPTLSKVCYTDFEENAFFVLDMLNGKELYRFDFTDQIKSCTIGFDNRAEKLATFSEDGNSVFLTYSDMKDNKCKTKLIDVQNGKILDSFEGYPIIFTEYFRDAVIINQSMKNVDTYNLKGESKYNNYTVAPVFRGYEDMKQQVEKVKEYIDGWGCL